jgi:hypothetical protein
MQESPVHILTIGSIVVVNTSGASTVLTAVSASDICPLGVCGEDKIDDGAGISANLEGNRVDVFPVHVSLGDVKLIVSYSKGGGG